MMKKLNWKPWQIILSAIAGVAVIGGGAAGIWYGIDQSIDDKIDSKVNAALETATAEPALDEPTAAATESETEPETEKEPDSVVAYADPNESETETKEKDQVLVNPPTTFEDNTIPPYKLPWYPLPSE